jgi:hypothetical protein
MEIPSTRVGLAKKMIGSTITKPDVKSIIGAVSTIIQSQMMEDTGVGKQVMANSDLYYFCEEKYINEKPYEFDEKRLALLREPPSVENIYEFLQALYDCAQFRYCRCSYTLFII